jgi:branched-chain amino acid transport system permease protein
MRLAGALAIIAAAAVVPLFAGEFWVTLMTQMMIFGLLALSADLLLGNAGLFSLCHASFFAVAAYATAILQVRHGVPTILAAPAGILAGSLLSIIFAFSVRTRGVYFILITLAFGYIVWGVAYRWASFTGGDNGVTNVPYPSVGGWSITSSVQYHYLVLVAVVLCVGAYRMLISSPFGLAMRGIKSSEPRLRSLGFVLSGVLASIAGVLYVYHNRFINPAAASFPVSVEAVLMAIIGGSGTILGPLIGSGIILLLRNWVSGYFHFYTGILGVVFIATVLWAPKGLMGLITRRKSGERGEGA